MPLDTNTRPAQTGGIDLSGIDIAAVIFEATGGAYGNPGKTQTGTGAGPVITSDWNTNGGDGPMSDHFDFSQPPADKDALIKLVADPEVSHPLLDMFKDDAPHFANGGPEGNGWVVVVAAVLIVAAFAAAAYCLAEKPVVEKPAPEPKVDPKTGLKIYVEPDGDGELRDPDADTGTLQSPADMMADLLKTSGIEGLDPTDVGITDLMAKLSDNMDKVTDLLGAMSKAQAAGDGGAFASILSELLRLAGIDGVAAEVLDATPTDITVAVFDAFDITGGTDLLNDYTVLHDADPVEVVHVAKLDPSEWVVLSDDGNP